MLFTTPQFVFADYDGAYVSKGKCSLQASSDGDCLYSNSNFSAVTGTWLNSGNRITVLTATKPVAAPKTGNGSECPTEFVYVRFDVYSTVYYGWACSANIITNDNLTQEHKQEFKDFPTTYWLSLAALREAYPDWKFVPIDTKLDFATVINNMDVGSKSLIEISQNQGYFSTYSYNYNWGTDTWISYDGARWPAANWLTIQYYLDPRNFLVETRIWQFESLSYTPSLQEITGVQKLLGSAYIAQFAEFFIDAAEETGVNPIYLAALSRQEVGGGSTAGTAISGLTFTYDGKTYSGLYNFYNIGASGGSDGLAVYRGLVNASNASLGCFRPWTDERKAIIGGACFISEGYIKHGQMTSYFKKWNTVYNYAISAKDENGKLIYTSPYSNYTHQYMQNIMAPRTEATKTYDSYKAMGILDSEFIFYIPVYSGMPTKTTLPPLGNPNNRLKSISINGTAITGFTHDRFSHTIQVENNINQANITAATVNSNAKVTGTGTFNLNVGTNSFTLTVTAQNGSTQAYTISIVRAPVPEDIVHPPVDEILKEANITNDGTYISNFALTTDVNDFKDKLLEIANYAEISVKRGNNDLTTGNLRTGDAVTIISGDETKTLAVVIYGDCTVNGAIDIFDLLDVRKHILKDITLTGAYAKAADVNKDGVIDIYDLLMIRKHILGDSFINQK